MMFLVDGIGFGTWATLLPSYKTKFGLDEAQLSLAMLGMVVGAVISMPLAGQAISRWGSRAVMLLAAPLYAFMLSLLAFSPNFVCFVLVATLFGAFKGAFDVAVNSHAITVENAGTKPIMATFQALWSIGGLVAALLVGLALRQQVLPFHIAVTMSAALMAIAWWYGRQLYNGDMLQRKAPSAEKKGFQLPNARLLRIGLLAAMALFGEGVMMDWSAVYSRSVAGASDWLAPISYGVFCLAMAAGRLGGDRLIARYGSVSLLRVSGTLCTIGLAIMVAIQVWPATFVGLLFAGLGLSNLVPILFGAGGRAHEGSVGQGIATVTTMGYFGFLAGPPVIGYLSHVIGLPGAFCLVVFFTLFIALWGARMLHGKRPASPVAARA